MQSRKIVQRLDWGCASALHEPRPEEVAELELPEQGEASTLGPERASLNREEGLQTGTPNGLKHLNEQCASACMSHSLNESGRESLQIEDPQENPQLDLTESQA